MTEAEVRSQAAPERRRPARHDEATPAARAEGPLSSLTEAARAARALRLGFGSATPPFGRPLGVLSTRELVAVVTRDVGRALDERFELERARLRVDLAGEVQHATRLGLAMLVMTLGLNSVLVAFVFAAARFRSGWLTVLGVVGAAFLVVGALGIVGRLWRRWQERGVGRLFAPRASSSTSSSSSSSSSGSGHRASVGGGGD